MEANDATADFHELRARLQDIAYRLLGSMADAEDVVQDVWLRWHGADQSTIHNLEAWLVTATTRTAIDRLRTLKVRRENYVGLWLPEPILGDAPDTPEQISERASDVSIALLTLLERLSPAARAAFVLRELFDVAYPEIAEIIEKNEAAVRQIVHRAKLQLRDSAPRHLVSPESHMRTVKRLAEAMMKGDFKSMKSLLDEEAQLIGDGGGHALSFPYPLLGGQRIAQFFYAANLRFKKDLGIGLATVNGELAILRYIGALLESVQSFETNGEQIMSCFVQRNPEKLQGVAAALGVRLFTQA
jgi:RNA polymerase sigma-70 factor (ECF subfamily)